jgi:hypothetical protein
MQRAAVGSVVAVGIYEMIVADKLLSDAEAIDRQLRRLRKQYPAITNGAWSSDVKPPT